MLELIAILGTAAAGLFWLVLKLVAKSAKTDTKSENLEADNKAAKAAKDKRTELKDESRDSLIDRLSDR